MGDASMFNNDMDVSRDQQKLIKVDDDGGDDGEQLNDTKKIEVGGLAGSQVNPRKSITMSRSQN